MFLNTSFILALEIFTGAHSCIVATIATLDTEAVFLSYLHSVLKPIAFASRALPKFERNSCVTRRELLAIVELVSQQVARFYIRTDHASLQSVIKPKILKDRRYVLLRCSIDLDNDTRMLMHFPVDPYDVNDPEEQKRLQQHDFNHPEVNQTQASFRFIRQHILSIDGKMK